MTRSFDGAVPTAPHNVLARSTISNSKNLRCGARHTRLPEIDRVPRMGAIKPWHLLCCLVVVLALGAITAAIIAAQRRK
ncbi:hypothetical protein [Paractinoplanes durhamensis]|uniref:Uncharacterized protein n=1 Tax=Paractinoplanes durhamensis TaxID=113563 RepID=A0ABQ3ZAS9_9ACTN|nr:hypothetical protein Adu01nite_79940 [Actinoplanes durhamensis]